MTYLWARTVTCPYCDGLVPLSPNWRLTPEGTGVRLLPDCADGPSIARPRVRVQDRRIRPKSNFPARWPAVTCHCPYADCGRVVDGDEIKRQAQAGQMGEQLFTVVCKRRVPGKMLTKSGKRGQDKWVRGYRAPRPEDENSRDHPGTARREAARVGGARHRAKRIVSGTVSNYDRGHKLYGMPSLASTCSRPGSFCATARAWRCSGSCWTLTTRQVA